MALLLFLSLFKENICSVESVQWYICYLVNWDFSAGEQYGSCVPLYSFWTSINVIWNERSSAQTECGNQNLFFFFFIISPLLTVIFLPSLSSFVVIFHSESTEKMFPKSYLKLLLLCVIAYLRCINNLIHESAHFLGPCLCLMP